MLSSVLSFTVLGASLVSSVLGTAIDPHFRHAESRARYTRAHSLGAGYAFDPRDGWTSLNVTDTAYKYSRARVPHAGAHGGPEPVAGLSRFSAAGHISSVHAAHKSKRTVSHGVLFGDELFGQSLGGSTTTASKPAPAPAPHVADPASDALSDVFKAVGAPETVVITWYTGHDLENPSCWSDSVWTPTDASFVAALTLEGWLNKPVCFDFLEMCNGPTTCAYVRVVDTCAGCAPGSQHVDLTRAAFSTLANVDVGVLNVQMRPVSSPAGTWHQDLWGPQVRAN